MKFGPATKLDTANSATSKRFVNDVISENCDVIVFFPIYSQFVALRKPDSARIVYKTYIFVKNNLFSYKSLKQD